MVLFWTFEGSIAAIVALLRARNSCSRTVNVTAIVIVKRKEKRIGCPSHASKCELA